MIGIILLNITPDILEDSGLSYTEFMAYFTTDTNKEENE